MAPGTQKKIMAKNNTLYKLVPIDECYVCKGRIHKYDAVFHIAYTRMDYVSKTYVRDYDHSIVFHHSCFLVEAGQELISNILERRIL